MVKLRPEESSLSMTKRESLKSENQCRKFQILGK